MRKKEIFILIAPFLLLVLGISLVSAHGLGQSFSQEVGDYLIEFEYESLEVTSDEAVPYVFRLLEKESQKPVSFESLLVRFVTADNSTNLVARLSEDKITAGAARLTLLLPAGQHQVELNFQNEEETFAETTFDHKVLSSEEVGKLPLPLIGSFIGGVGLGALGVRLLSAKSPKKNKD